MRVSEQRVDKRFRAQVRVTLRYGRSAQELVTEDVGYRGVFLRTEAPPELRQLARLEIALPDTGERLTVHGMAVHCVAVGNPSGRVPGVGVQFYAVDKATHTAWAAFIHRIEKAHPEREVKRPARRPSANDAYEPARPSMPGPRAELELELHSVEELRTLYARDITQGGMFIVTDLVLAPGTPLHIDVVHPLSRAVFTLDAEVTRGSIPGEMPGLAVVFENVDDDLRDAFLEFVRDTFSMAPPGLLEADDLLATG